MSMPISNTPEIIGLVLETKGWTLQDIQMQMVCLRRTDTPYQDMFLCSMAERYHGHLNDKTPFLYLPRKPNTLLLLMQQKKQFGLGTSYRRYSVLSQTPFLSLQTTNQLSL